MADNNDEIEFCLNIEPHEITDAIKSKAVVKFSAVQVPANFNRLQCNTNLNLPPSNWLTTSDSSYGLHQALYQSPGFASSFRMAHMFPDCVGEVDVVSDAENIKRLLKLPYTSKGAISMIVHKVGNTLLLDEFDVNKYLLRKADDDWKWLRTFILEQILDYSDDHNFCLKDKSREAIQTKNLLSKFLYHSLKHSATESPLEHKQNIRQELPITGPLLPEPNVEENVPDPQSSHVFNRNVVWTFEDIRMLIGTDMPIFGGPNRPAISLRLRDQTKPINVLTGIDYWLDNLMCNVPEVVMCYHLDGIVQRYEIIKTEDLPYLENSKFSPKVVRNVAQNILAFLNANVTKAGHTYWLFKGRNDDVVKLYDLTTLCKDQATEENCDEKQGNPFTVPVAMLLYTVARNMKNTVERMSPQKAGSICALLDNCIKLLPKEKYPQIVTSSYYILSDLHVPAGIDPKSPNFDVSDIDSDTQSVCDEDDFSFSDDYFNSFGKELSDNSHHFAVKHICDTLRDYNSEHNSKPAKEVQKKPSPLQGSTEERCLKSLSHISAGLSCLQFFNSNQEKFIKESEATAKEEERQRILHEEQNPNIAKPFKPIPLPYESLTSSSKNDNVENKIDAAHVEEQSKCEREGKNKKASKTKRNKAKEATEQIKGEIQLQPQEIAINFNSQLFGSWNVHLKLLLLEKACLTYATLAEHYYVMHKYGACLKAIYVACRCQQVLIKYVSKIVSQKSCLLGRAGDCFFQMSKNWDTIDENLEQFFKESDENIINELDKELSDDEPDDLIIPQKNIEHLMVSSCRCYENALSYIIDNGADVEISKKELLRRLGNVRNELGLKYMFWAQEEFSKFTQNELNGDKKIVEDKIENNLENVTEILDEKDINKENPVYINLSMKSYDCLLQGILTFIQVGDNVNLAFLYCNMGRFMRFRAHLYQVDENSEIVKIQKAFYNEAFSYYEKAKDILGTRKLNAELWDLVHWELSTATFTLAKQLQDFSTTDPTTQLDLEKEVLELLQKSLKLCDVEHAGSRQILYTYRSGLIHKRIASFHYSQLRNNCTDAALLPKTTLQLCKYHYERAANILDSLKEASDFLTVQLERVSLYEFLAEYSSNSTYKTKHMQAALDILLSSKSVFEHTSSMYQSAENDNVKSNNNSNALTLSSGDEFCKHMLLFESRLQNELKTLIKLFLSGKDPKKMADTYKKMYMETLVDKKTTGQQNYTVEQLALKYANLLERLNQLIHTQQHTKTNIGTQ
ncbi:erythroid differentiation-related factor 1-like isoform X1 [Teleopsis dalmanni]|uniref:erythroid differentiation-related factor 1-like isoform X1 n=1 Tax=Teleopsis dalmanni TaxID=139649 RepID=UPI0018CC934B|nr:erythroid differentiation-related factor 1-like isoform X1 [Teleopsis dalmanni]